MLTLIFRCAKAVIAGVALLSCVPHASAAYMFVALEAEAIPGVEAGRAGDYRIIPVYQTDSRDGRHLMPAQGGPILAFGYNVCRAAYLCAFKMSDQDLERLKAGEQMWILFKDGDEVPERLSDLGHDNVYRVTDCQPNNRCLVIDDRGDRLVGEVIVQDRQSDCIATNSQYHGLLEEVLVQLTASMQAAGGAAVPTMMTVKGLAPCVMPVDLPNYLEVLASESAIAELHTLASWSFFATKRLSSSSVKHQVDLLKRVYLVNSKILATSVHAGKVQFQNQLDRVKSESWNAPLMLPSNREVCTKVRKQLLEQGNQNVPPCQ